MSGCGGKKVSALDSLTVDTGLCEAIGYAVKEGKSYKFTFTELLKCFGAGVDTWTEVPSNIFQDINIPTVAEIVGYLDGQSGLEGQWFWYGGTEEQPDFIVRIDKDGTSHVIKAPTALEKIRAAYVDSEFGDDDTAEIFSLVKKFKTIGAAEQALIDTGVVDGSVVAYGNFVEDSNNIAFDGITTIFGNLELTGGTLRDVEKYKLIVSGTVKLSTASTEIGDFKDMRWEYDTLDVSSVLTAGHGQAQRNLRLEGSTTFGNSPHPDGNGRFLSLKGNILDENDSFSIIRMHFKDLVDTKLVVSGEKLETRDLPILHSGTAAMRDTSVGIFKFDTWKATSNITDANYTGINDEWGLLYPSNNSVLSITELDLQVGAGQYVATTQNHTELKIENSKIEIECLSTSHNCGFIQSSVYTNSVGETIVRDSSIKLKPLASSNKFHWIRDRDNRIIYENCIIVIEQNSNFVPYVFDLTDNGGCPITLRNCKIFVENGTNVINYNGTTPMNIEVENCFSNVPLFGAGQNVIDLYNQSHFFVNTAMSKPVI